MTTLKLLVLYAVIRWLSMVAIKFQQDPIETMIVAIEADLSEFFDQIDQGVDKGGKKLEGLGKKTDAVGKAGAKGGKAGAKGLALMGAAFGFAGAAAAKVLDVVTRLAAAIPRMFKQMRGEAIALTAEFDQARITFKNMLGGEGEAAKFIKTLREQAGQLGISFSEASRFAKAIKPDTRSVEEFNELLRLATVGARDANLSVNELIFSFNEAVAGDFVSIRDRLDIPREVIARIKASEDVTAALAEELNKLFTKRGINDLDEFSNTLSVVQNKLKSFKEGLLLIAGEFLLDEEIGFFQGLNELLEANREDLEALAGAVGSVVADVTGFFRGGIANLNLKPLIGGVKSFVEWLGRVLKTGKALFLQIKPLVVLFAGWVITLGKVVLVLSPIGIALGALGKILGRLDEALIAAAQLMAIFKAGVEGLLAGFKPLFSAFSNFGKAIGALFRGEWDEAVRLGKAGMAELEDGMFDLSAAAQATKDSFLQSAAEIGAATRDIAEDFTIPDFEGTTVGPTDFTPDVGQIQEQLDALSIQMIDAQEQRDEALETLQQAHGERMEQIISKANEKAAQAIDKANEKLANLTETGIQDRVDIIADAQRELAELATDTDQGIEERRQEFDQNELRETEDHLRDMRQLTQRHLEQLENAIKSRDARAVRDLQAGFQQERTEREQEFDIGQSRDSADQNQELAAIRSAEARKRDEILASQAQELEQQRLHEDQRRAVIINSRNEELQKIDQQATDAATLENQRFTEREAALNASLQSQLEAISKSLVDQKDVTEEGARLVLETLNEVFGAGGDIDKLMENFAARRKLKASIVIDFKENIEQATERSALLVAGGGASGVRAFAEGGTLVANKPTLALFGEREPEIAQFTPLSQLSESGSGEPNRMILEFTGSAPPGVGVGERDQIARVLIEALRDTGQLGDR